MLTGTRARRSPPSHWVFRGQEGNWAPRPGIKSPVSCFCFSHRLSFQSAAPQLACSLGGSSPRPPRKALSCSRSAF